MIIDVHTHLGEDRVFDEERNEEDIQERMNKHGIDISIVQPMFGTICMKTFEDSHNRIYRMTEKNKGRIYGMASVNPHIDVNDFKAEVKRCVRELNFVGIKLHPAAHACSPGSRDGLMLIDTADSLSVPVMVHTGAGIPAANPANVIPIAKKYPETKFVLAHSGMIIGADEALIAAMECPNIYLETSWTIPDFIIKFVKTIGADRVMFASDLGLNIAGELAKYKELNLSAEELAHCLGGTAAMVFNIPN